VCVWVKRLAPRPLPQAKRAGATIGEISIGGGDASVLAFASNAISLAANGAHVYYAAWGGGVNAVAVGSGKVRNIAAANYPAAVALGS
jgi:hypothetical protein